ncbi:MAG TPA: sodium-translocating pyrophosphatase [Candidatus Methylacidiphilales bacterium]|jgi:K(+)-stimulated pyrophosphate-energized sodium pump|nr:sodium-translocating pyrophosphatase [Candidatus Methylacidiphilales bacterium]
MESFLLQNGIPVALVLGLLAIVTAIILAVKVHAAATGTDLMREIAAAVQEGAKAYLSRQIKTISAIALVLLVLIWIFKGPATGIGFLIGATCSLLAGFIGMRVAVISNIRTAQAATIGAQPALRIAFNGGAVTGLLVVGLALLAVGGFYLGADAWFHQPDHKSALNAIVGLALGSSLISVFARLGGGIYTKAADVGADLVGKIEQNLDEDDPRNPATIADNVGDNVGDCAGMAADVFETYAVSLIGSVLVAALGFPGNPEYIIFPFMLCGLSVIASVLGIIFINVGNLKPANALLAGVALSALIAGVLFLPLSCTLFGDAWLSVYVPTLVGLAMTFITVLITNYYTATQYAPVRKIAKASETGHATNIIAGLAVGLHATFFPVVFIGLSIVVSYAFHGLYGVAIAVVSMLSLSGIIISLDAFGPITDNAGGLAVMSKLPKEVRKITDELDAIGNTMKAVTKGYAIASAGLAALVLFASYVNELKTANLNIDFTLENPTVLIGLFIGGMLPFLFVAYTMDAVGKAAGAVVLEVRRQLAARPGILTGTEKPEYGTCVDIVTKAALLEMIFPALLPILGVLITVSVPTLIGHFFPESGLNAKVGATALGGVLVGTITTGLFIGISLTSSGGAWDNAKKFIEEGNYGGKGSPAHAAAVTGDTVGDPYKDTSGPAINPMIKVVNVLAILVIPLFF